MMRRKEEIREIWRLKKALREKNKKKRAKKKKEQTDLMIERQPRLRRWGKGEGGLEVEGRQKEQGPTPNAQNTGGKKGIKTLHCCSLHKSSLSCHNFNSLQSYGKTRRK